MLIATKAGLTRNGPDVLRTNGKLVRLGPAAWPPVGRPEYLRQQALMSLRRLGVDHIDLFQLHRVDPKVPLEDQVGELKRLQDEGTILAIGLSQVTIDQVERARTVAAIATVQNRYNLTDRRSADVLEYCTRHGIGFIPWAPVAAGELARSGARSTGSPPRMAPARLRWRWPGCWPAPKSSCPSPAPPGSRTWKTT